MATVNYIRETKQSIGAMNGVISYCVQEKKVYDERSGRRLVSGINCDGENAFTEFTATKKAYGKTDGMNFYHYVQSFSPNEEVTAKEVHRIGLEFAEKAWEGYEVLVTTHCDADHLHNHFVINSVGFKNGYKLRQNRQTLKNLRAFSDELCIKHGLSVMKPYEKNGSKISAREYRAAYKGQSWKFKLTADINFVMNRCMNREDFIRKIKRLGYEITWTKERKYITYLCPNGMKCRDIRLHDKKYLKGNMENEFNIRKKYARELGIGYADGEEQPGSIGARTDTVSADSLCDTGGAEKAGKPAAEGCNGVSAEAVSADRTAGDEGGTAGSHEGSNGYRGRLYEENGQTGDGGERKDGGADTADNSTGWEKSREIYFRLLRNSGGENERIEHYYDGLEEKDYEDIYSPNGDILDAFGLGVRGVLETGNLINDNPEDPDERRKRIKAQQNGANFGAVIGLVAGALSAISANGSADNEPTEDAEKPTLVI